MKHREQGEKGKWEKKKMETEGAEGGEETRFFEKSTTLMSLIF